MKDAISCTECQRRKQKCSRVWPCDICVQRKVPQLCDFTTTNLAVIDALPNDTTSSQVREVSSVKRTRDDSESGDVSGAHNGLATDPADGLKVLGYTDRAEIFNLASVSAEGSDKTNEPILSEQHKELQSALEVFPSRDLTDIIVKHFFDEINYRYYAIYPPAFMKDYAQWWSDRADGERLSVDFTCLFLRVCAYATQYCSSQLRDTIEPVLKTAAHAQSLRFHRAAEELNRTLAHGSGGVVRVQQLFLKQCWLKAEGLVIEAWHALSTTIHEAQELGFFTDTTSKSLDDFEREMRRRLWCLLYVWDRQMAGWLARPKIIESDDLTFPDVRLEDAIPQPGLVPPYQHIVLQAELIQMMSRKLATSKLSASELTSSLIADIDDWITTLPSVYRLVDPDKSWDKAYPYIARQRPQLHTVIYMVRLGFVKQSLTKPPPNALSKRDAEDRSTAVDFALNVLDAAWDLHFVEFATSAHFCMSTFAIFDTVLTLGSAVMQDHSYTLPRRQDVLEAISRAANLLYKLSLTTEIGGISYDFVTTLIGKLPLLPFEQNLFASTKGEQTSSSDKSSPSQELAGGPKMPTPAPLSPLADDPDHRATVSGLQTESPPAADQEYALDHVDFTWLDQMWDWEAVNLETFRNEL